MVGERKRAAAALIVLFAAGCAATAPTLGGDADPQLAGDEAALVIERDGDLAWRSLRLERGGTKVTLALDGPAAGYGLGVYRVAAGRWRLVSASVGPWDDLGFSEPIEVVVQPGKLNYVGELTFKRDADGDVWHRVRNRSGRMLTELRGRLPALADRYPFAYVGEEGDDWTSSIGGDRR